MPCADSLSLLPLSIANPNLSRFSLGVNSLRSFLDLPDWPKCHGSVCSHGNQLKGYIKKSGQTFVINTKALGLYKEERSVHKNPRYDLLGRYLFKHL